MNEISTTPAAPRAALVSGAPVAGLVPTTIEEVFRLAGAVAKSGLAPKDMATPEKLTIAIMTGLEVGLPPMQAIQSIAVINGRPTIWGDGLLAVVRRSPLCGWIKEWTDGDGDAMTAFCQTLRSGEGEPVTRSFSAMDAKSAGLLGKTGPWSQYRKRMLQMRARALCLRDVYADLLKGVQVREEIEDYAPPRDITPSGEPSPAIARLQASRGAQAASALPPITEHVEAEIAAMGRESAEEGAVDVGDVSDDFNDDGDDVLGPDATNELFAQALRDFSAALFKGSSKKGLGAHATAFWDARTDCPDPGSPERDLVDRVFYSHVARVEGAATDDKCRAAVDQIIREVA